MDFATEADLCQFVIDRIRPEGWEVYPEWNTWDFMAVLQEGKETFVVGVQAKLKWNIALIRQCADSKDKAHWTVALVPHMTRKARKDYLPVFLSLGVIPAIIRRDRIELLICRSDWMAKSWNIEVFKNTTHRKKTWNTPLLAPFKYEEPTYTIPAFEPIAQGGVPCGGGVPTPYSLSVRRLLEHCQELNRPFTINEIKPVYGYSYTSCNVVVNAIAIRTREKEGRSYLYELRPDAFEISQKIAPTGWIQKYERT